LIPEEEARPLRGVLETAFVVLAMAALGGLLWLAGMALTG